MPIKRCSARGTMGETNQPTNCGLGATTTESSRVLEGRLHLLMHTPLARQLSALDVYSITMRSSIITDATRNAISSKRWRTRGTAHVVVNKVGRHQLKGAAPRQHRQLQQQRHDVAFNDHVHTQHSHSLA